MEPELSDKGHSGDELSDDSVGSIIDDDIVHHSSRGHTGSVPQVYQESRSRRFKIPELPTRFNKEEILTQYVEENSYEMDSFCVNSNIGLTQVHEGSELELAEMRLEKQRKAKKEFRRICTQDDSPDVTVVKKINRRED